MSMPPDKSTGSIKTNYFLVRSFCRHIVVIVTWHPQPQKRETTYFSPYLWISGAKSLPNG
jgi:hypothetical protein